MTTPITVGAAIDFGAYLANHVGGRPAEKWPVPKSAHPGDRLIFLVPAIHGPFRAYGIVASEPKAGRWGDSRRYFANADNLRPIDPPLRLARVAQAFPRWKWATYPRAYTTVPEEYEAEFWKLVTREPEWEELENILTVVSGRRGQGLIVDPRVRRAVETRAMRLAERYYGARCASVRNTATTEPFDFQCRDSDDHEIRVEVKGSTGECSEIHLTVGEVESTRGSSWRSDLFLVRGIRVVQHADGPRAVGGQIRVIEGWMPKADALKPLVYRYTVPESA